MWISTDPIYIPFICRQLMLEPQMNSQCIVCGDADGLVAGVVYEHYNTVSVTTHIWIEYGRTPSRDWYAAIFDYPFNRLGVKKLIGKVAEDNMDAVKLDAHFGFELEATVEDYSPSGALRIYTMVREQCRILNSPLWARTVSRVATCR